MRRMVYVRPATKTSIAKGRLEVLLADDRSSCSASDVLFVIV